MAAVIGFCPVGGTFYVCQGNTTQFLGCCTDDPCSDGTGDCPQRSLRYTSYNSDEYASIPAEACASSGLWYTCSAITTAFMGCCLENPCQNDGCAQGNLTAARLSDKTSDAKPFLTSTASSSDAKSLSTGATIGVAIGAALIALLIGTGLFFLYKRREAGKRQRRDELGSQSGPNGTPGMYMPSPYQDSAGFPSPQFPPGAGQMYGTDKMQGWSDSPSLFSTDQRPMSTAPSGSLGTHYAHGRVPSSHPSISSLGSSQAGFLSSHNQQGPPQPYLNPVAEMDNTEVAVPVSELAGSPQRQVEDHDYGTGYDRIATRGDS